MPINRFAINGQTYTDILTWFMVSHATPILGLKDKRTN